MAIFSVVALLNSSWNRNCMAISLKYLLLSGPLWKILANPGPKLRAVDLVEIFSIKHCFSNEVGVININHLENFFKPRIQSKLQDSASS